MALKKEYQLQRVSSSRRAALHHIDVSKKQQYISRLKVKFNNTVLTSVVPTKSNSQPSHLYDVPQLKCVPLRVTIPN